MARTVSGVLTGMTGIVCCLVPQMQVGAAEDAIRGFVGVEPFELRLEALVRVEPFRDAWELEPGVLGAVEREAILEKMEGLFASEVEVRIPESPPRFTERTVRFIVPDAEKGFVPDVRDAIPLDEALVGLTFSAAVRGVSELELDWLWFAPGQERLVVEVASRGKPSARVLTPVENTMRWRQSGGSDLPSLRELPAMETRETRPLRLLLVPALAMGLGAVLAVIRRRGLSLARVGGLLAGGCVAGALALGVRGSEVVEPEDPVVEEILYALLRNTYHAFDFRDEEAIYDTLEASVTGPLLERVYLEMRESLELEETGGPRVRVYEIALRECREADGGGGRSERFRRRAEWVTIGEVTHWGHTHERTNRYEAEMTVSAVGDTWKISGLDLLNEERVRKISRREAAPESS
ncbi:MAG: hypothetical protein GXX91_04310 [Verrucomicrobiaceae bacterium]|nr:hypothetical protein [Verrucomicrobiaceae bacterium]